MHAHTHMPSWTWLTSEDVSGNEASLPAPPLACLPVWAGVPSDASFRRQGLGLQCLSTARSLLPLPDHRLSEHRGIPAGPKQAQSLYILKGFLFPSVPTGKQALLIENELRKNFSIIKKKNSQSTNDLVFSEMDMGLDLHPWDLSPVF